MPISRLAAAVIPALTAPPSMRSRAFGQRPLRRAIPGAVRPGARHGDGRERRLDPGHVERLGRLRQIVQGLGPGAADTSAPIAKALVDAKRRAVAVTVILDKSQRTEKYFSATFLAILHRLSTASSAP
jgi:hypothetical protein